MYQGQERMLLREHLRHGLQARSLLLLHHLVHRDHADQAGSV